MTTEKIKDKIAALLAKAESTKNLHEADAFMAKVNELLERHQIEMHEIRAHGGDKDPMTHIVSEATRAAEWPTRMGWALAAYYGCKMLRYKQVTLARYTMKVVGRESAVTTFDLMFPFVQAQVRQQARRMSKEYGVTIAKAERSVGMALASRIWKLVDAANVRRAQLVGTGLVPVSDNDAYVAEHLGETIDAKKLTQPIEAGAREYADKVSLHVQTTGKTKHKQIGGA